MEINSLRQQRQPRNKGPPTRSGPVFREAASQKFKVFGAPFTLYFFFPRTEFVEMHMFT
jgi:hypothetical protein